MAGCNIVYTSPDRCNIFYAVKERTTVDEDLEIIYAYLLFHLG